MAYGMNVVLLMMCCQDLVPIFAWWIAAFTSNTSTSKHSCILGKLLLLAAGRRRAEIPCIDRRAWTWYMKRALIGIWQGVE
jgi:hypothetical protein